MKRKTPEIPSLCRALIEARTLVGYQGPTKDCSVISVSVACGITYLEAHALMNRHGFNPEVGAMQHEIIRAVRSIGFSVKTVTASDFAKMRYPDSKKHKRFVTPRQVDRFPSAWKNIPPALLWGVGHVLAVKDGVVQDWSIGRSLHISHISFVMPKNETLVL